MPMDHAWLLVDSLRKGRRLIGLRRALRKLSPDEIRAFDRWVEDRVEALKLAAVEAEEFTSECEGDVVTYVMAAVVAAGRREYEKVLANPALLDKDWDDELGEDFLDLPATVFEQLYDEPFDDSEAIDGLPVVDLQTILQVSLSDGTPEMPFWRLEAHQSAELIWDTKDDWASWWKPSGLDNLTIWLETDFMASDPHPPVAGFRVGKRRCDFTSIRPAEELFTENEQRALARRDVWAAFEEVRARFGLGPLPPWTRVSDRSLDTGWGTIHP